MSTTARDQLMTTARTDSSWRQLVATARDDSS
eukprot:CAMPEP_0119362976 /NCGR_PEP_ID=MMETSP1334-20130426/9849_1 /TAXON_ID=127549 /ORGANISM="Calcidiscus leptoporus, Strain RCC1130" /LENGTH=31 /DNA_ID= /DNA_START= /DNA_END= /DNA_ORIENTATION=